MRSKTADATVKSGSGQENQDAQKCRFTSERHCKDVQHFFVAIRKNKIKQIPTYFCSLLQHWSLQWICWCAAIFFALAMVARLAADADWYTWKRRRLRPHFHLLSLSIELLEVISACTYAHAPMKGRVRRDLGFFKICSAIVTCGSGTRLIRNVPITDTEWRVGGSELLSSGRSVGDGLQNKHTEKNVSSWNAVGRCNCFKVKKVIESPIMFGYLLTF